jgi:hypothetical protein
MLAVVGLADALTRRWDTDAHASGVLVPHAADETEPSPFGSWEPRMPRLRKTARRALLEAGQSPALCVVFADLDRVPHDPWPDGAAGAEAARAVLVTTALCPEASAYATRAGLRLVWSLARPVPVAIANGWLEAWLAHLDGLGVGRAVGLAIDTTAAQWTRGFRLPRVIRDGEHLDPALDDTAARRGIRLDWTPPTPPATAPLPAAAGVIDLGGEVVEVPGLDDLPRLDDVDWGILGSTEGIAHLVGALRAGDPYSAPGARDTVLVKGLGSTVRALLRRVEPPAPPDNTDEIRRAALDLAERAIAAWLPSVVAAVALDPAEAPPASKAWRLAVEFAWADVAEAAADLVETLAKVAAAKAAEAAEAAEAPDEGLGTAPDAKAAEAAEAAEAPATVAEAPPSAPPPAAMTEVERADGRVDLLRDPDPDVPVVVVVGQRYVVLDLRDPEGGYGPPIPAVALSAEMRRRAPGVPCLSPRGVPLPPARIVAHHGDVAVEVVAAYALPPSPTAITSRASTTFDTTTRVLRRVVAPLRAVEPAEDAAVADWLAALCAGEGSAPLDSLLDWLATVATLDRATATIYLRGSADAGKSLFANGVSSLWSDAAVGFTEAISQFNAGLLRCPVVHLDEGIDKRLQMLGASNAFRRLSANRTHTVEAKYEMAGSLTGHPRVIVGANNDRALPIGSGHHTRDDLGALARRILYLHADGPAAARVLAAVSAERLALWTTPSVGAIPRHLAWLRATRGAEAHARAGQRFLVGGVESRWHRSLLLQSGNNEAVLAALVEAVVKGGKMAVAVEPAPDADPTKARIWVNVARLHSGWKGLVDEDVHRPVRASIARTVRDLSASERSKVRRLDKSSSQQLRCWDIAGDLVIRVAEAHGSPDLDALRRALAGLPVVVRPGGSPGMGAPAQAAGGGN